MPSPFPGMDPYLESPAFWRDFHQSFIIYWRDWLADQLPDHYDVRIDERVGLIAEDEVWGSQMLPDVNISLVDPLPRKVPKKTSGALGAEPVTLAVRFLETASEAYLKIYHRHDATLIGVLELLSPTNKTGADRLTYLQKRNELLRDTVHLVELDLLLKGARLPTVGKLPPGDYYGYVSRGDQRPKCEVYAWKLQGPLTKIRIPLKAPDPDLVFDLPGLVQFTYQKGRYERVLPYHEAPPVALSKQAEKWRQQLLKDFRRP